MQKQFLQLARGGRETRALNTHEGWRNWFKEAESEKGTTWSTTVYGRRARHTGSPSSRVAYTMLVLSPAARPAQTAFNQFAVAARSLMPF